MGVKLLLLYVICQIIITTTLGRVTLPLSDSIGKVTPIKPKPLTPSTVSSSVTKSSLTCDSKVIPKSSSSTVKGSVTREFSSPMALTSTSRALPVPKIDSSSSIENVKIPERLREKFLALCKGSIKIAKPGSRSQVSLPYKNPFLSSPTKISNASPSTALSDVYTAPLNKLSSINSLPHVPLESLKPNGFSRSSCKTNKYKQPPTFKSTLSVEARTPSCSEKFTSNTLGSPCSSPHPLHYKSPHLPGVKTPSESLIYRPFPYKAAGKYNFPSQSTSQNLLGPKTPILETSSNSLSGRNDVITSPSLLPTTEILKPVNPIQLPKSPSNIHIVSSARNAIGNQIWSSKEACINPASVAFESKLEPPKSALPSISLKGEQDPINSLTYSWAGRTSDLKLKHCSPPVTKPPIFTPRNTFMNPPKAPVVPTSPSSPIVDVLSNRISSFDCLENIGAPNLFPIIGVCTIENIDTHDLGGNDQTCFDSNSLEKINLRSPYSYQECVPLKYSPPIIPTEPIPTIYYGTSFSPITCSASRISQTPVSYIPQPPSSSVAQATSNMVSSITNIVSDVVQNIVSSYKSNISSAPQNIPHIIPTYKTQSDPYTDLVLIPDETLSALSVLPFSQNPVNTISILPEVSAPATSDSSSVKLLDSSCQSSAFEITSSQPVLIASSQPTATMLPTTSLITFSSPPICPSYLPSPTLPSYPVISSPIYMEAPVFKKKSSKKDSDAEKMIELMLLAEILNNDETFDWDDLDTLLAFLSLS